MIGPSNGDDGGALHAPIRSLRGARIPLLAMMPPRDGGAAWTVGGGVFAGALTGATL